LSLTFHPPWFISIERNQTGLTLRHRSGKQYSSALVIALGPGIAFRETFDFRSIALDAGEPTAMLTVNLVAVDESPELVVVVLVMSAVMSGHKAQGIQPFGLYPPNLGEFVRTVFEGAFVKDNDTGKVFDTKGKLVRIDSVKQSPYSLQGRTLEYSVSGAKSTRVYLNNKRPSQISVVDGKTVQLFPVQDSQKSIPYRIEGTADDWQLVDTWDTKSHSDKFKFVPGNVPMLAVTSVPVTDPAREEFIVRVYRNKGGDKFADQSNPREGSISTEFESSSVWLAGDIEGVYKVDLLRRKFQIVSEGFIAYGKKGDAKDQCNPNLPLILKNLAEPNETNSYAGIQWSPTGKEQEYKQSSGIQIGFGRIEGDKRIVKCRILASTPSQDSTLELSIPQKDVVSKQVSPTESIYQERNEWEVTLLAPRNLRKIDLNINVASEPFKVIARTSKPLLVKLGSEPTGAAVVEVSKPQNGDSGFVTYWIKIPEKFKKDELRLSYFRSDGRELFSFARTSLPTGYIGIQFQGQLDTKNEVQGLILKARPKNSYVLKDIPLYPETKR
jgi:hypothetical protein